MEEPDETEELEGQSVDKGPEVHGKGRVMTDKAGATRKP